MFPIDRAASSGFTAAIVLAAAGACAPPEPALSLRNEFSAPPGSGEPNLFAAASGRVMLTWHEPAQDGGHALRLAVRDAGGWSEPLTVVAGRDFFVNWADFPSAVELGDGSWIVHWLEKVADPPYAYHVKMVTSHDRGSSWSEPIVPHRDDSPQEHGFVSMLPWGEGGAALIWLDGRQMKSAEGAGEHEGLDLGEMSVRATTIDADGRLGEDVLLDGRVCECCQTALASTSRGLVAAYRDRSEEEIRNIAVVRQVEGSWTEPRHVADDGWYYPGCPVNGPQLSARRDALVAAWFTAPEGRPAVYVAFSADAGETFGPPIRIDDGDPLGRVDVELLGDGSALVSWLERTPAAAEVRARRARSDGDVGDSRLISVTSESRASGFPRMARAGDEVIFAWTLVGEDGGVRVASASGF